MRIPPGHGFQARAEWTVPGVPARANMGPMSRRHRTVAYAPLAAFAVTSLMLFLGLVGMFVTLTLVMVTIDVGETEPAMAGVTQTATALVAGFGACALGGLGGLLLAGQSKAALDSAGCFLVRSWPPWRVRSVRLDGLAYIGSSRGPLRRRGLLAATVHSTTLSLRDHNGSTVEWNPAFWRGSERVVAALRAAAFDAGALVEPGAVRILDDPPFGGL